MTKKILPLIIIFALLLTACAELVPWQGEGLLSYTAPPPDPDNDNGNENENYNGDNDTPPDDVTPGLFDNFPLPRDLIYGLTPLFYPGYTMFFSAPQWSFFDNGLPRHNVFGNSFNEEWNAVREKYTFVFPPRLFNIDALRHQFHQQHNEYSAQMEVAAIPVTQLAAWQGTVVTSGRSNRFFRPIHYLPNADFSQPHFNLDIMESLRVRDGMYAILGDASRYQKNTVVLYFNTPALRAAGIYEDLYALVESGHWTWEVFGSMLARANENSNRPFVAGTTLRNEVAAAALYNSFGHRLVTNTPTDPVNNFNAYEMAGVTNQISAFFNAGTYFASSDLALSAFYDGNLLFMIGRLGEIDFLDTAFDSWGFVPLPTAYVDQTQSAFLCPDQTMVFVVPRLLVSNINAVGAFIQSINVAAQYYMAIYAAAFMQDIVREAGALRMFNLVQQNPFIEPAFVFGGANAALANSSYRALYNAVARQAVVETPAY
ncbi:MAG: hypothetical protein FWB93_01250 [Oscillospiraceae bacterium]|nr:hypothetical protein [Oscillospiraceae bacterium]